MSHQAAEIIERHFDDERVFHFDAFTLLFDPPRDEDMIEQAPTLGEEAQTYLGVVDTFREEGCDPFER